MLSVYFCKKTQHLACSETFFQDALEGNMAYTVFPLADLHFNFVFIAQKKKHLW